MARRRESERGLALVIVLWVVAAAALLVLSFNASVRSGATISMTEQRYSKIESLLDAGLEIAAAHLIDEQEERRWLPDGEIHYVDFGGGRLNIAITDPNGLIDLNKARTEVLFEFFQTFTTSRIKAAFYRDLILKFRGEDKKSALKGEVAKPKDSRPSTGGNSFSPQPGKLKALAFVDVTQVGRLEGMDLDLFRSIRPFITLYSRDGRINPNSAPRPVLMSIPKLTAGDIDKLLAMAASDGINESNAVSSPLTKAKEYFNLETGPAFIVTVTAKTPGLKMTVSKEFVISIGLDKKAPYRLLSWKLATPPA